MSKNPQMTILSEAAIRYLMDGTSVRDTVDLCSNPRMFVSVIKVTGGAVWRGAPLGRVARFYWSTNGDPILYSSNGRRVARTEGARPMMEMVTTMPDDLDRKRYHAAAEKLIEELGVPINGLLLSGARR
jgi:hypothetical protein